MTDSGITQPTITQEDRDIRRAMGWVLRGRHVYTLRSELYARGWVWDAGAGGMLAPSREEWEEWRAPPVVEGDVLIRSGGRYCMWPVRCVPTKYLVWLMTCNMSTQIEKDAAKNELASRNRPARQTDESIRREDEQNQAKFSKAHEYWKQLSFDEQQSQRDNNPGMSSVMLILTVYGQRQ